MSLFGSFDRTRHLNELSEPLETQGSGVLTPAQRRAATLSNLYGTAYDGGVLASPSLPSTAVGDKFTVVPNVASGGVLAAHITQTMTHSIRIKSADGTLYYLMATNVVTNRTGGA